MILCEISDGADIRLAVANLKLLSPVQWFPQLCFQNTKIRNEKLGDILDIHKLAVL